MKKYTVGALLLTSAMAAPALAAGTDAGVEVVNNFTVGYSVGGAAQTPITTSDADNNNAKFLVDRKVNLSVTAVGARTQYNDGTPVTITAFDVANLSNETLDFRLAISDILGTDFDHDSYTIAVDDPANGTVGTYDAANDTLDFIDELAADDTRRVFIIANGNNADTDGQIDDVILTATAAGNVTGTDGDYVASAGSLAADLVGLDDSDANTAGIDTVFADDAGEAVGEYDGQAFDTNGYQYQSAAISLAKSSVILWDPVNGTTNPKAIPGAVVEYCLAVTNTGSQAASGVSFSDSLDSVRLESLYSANTDAGVAAGEPAQRFRLAAENCDETDLATGVSEDTDATGAGDNGSITATTVNVANQSVPSGSAGSPTVRAVRFRVKIK